MNSSNHENGEKLAFSKKFSFLLIFRLLSNQNQGKFRKSQWQKSSSTFNNMIYPKELVPGLNRFYSGHFQNTINFYTFFRPCFFYQIPIEIPQFIVLITIESKNIKKFQMRLDLSFL